jgi:hypothetical protein
MDLKELQEMWEKDSVIDEVMIDQASIKIPQLHSRYLAFHNHYTLLLKKGVNELKAAEHKKWLFYSGKADPEEYSKEPFKHKVPKTDIPRWMSADEDLMKIETKLEYYSCMVNSVEEILKQIHQMSFNIKNVIAWRQFSGGV